MVKNILYNDKCSVQTRIPLSLANVLSFLDRSIPKFTYDRVDSVPKLIGGLEYKFGVGGQVFIFCAQYSFAVSFFVSVLSNLSC